MPYVVDGEFRLYGLEKGGDSVVWLKTMLRQLRIKDFAIIDSLAIRFDAGLNVLTGETGAGKSIIVDALGLALGERAQTDMIRTGRSEAAVEAYFDISSHPLLERIGIPAGEGIIIRRNVSSAGKSRAYINDTMVNVQSLLEIGKSLVDIHGQHEHQSLLSTDNQRAVIDAFGRLFDQRSVFERLFREVQSMKSEVAALRSNVREKEQRIDLLRFQINEIESASLKAGEKEELAGEKAILANLAKLRDLADTAYMLLYSGDGAASEKLSSVLSMMREASRMDEGVSEILHLLESATPLLEDAAVSLRGHKEKYDIDPARLDTVEERLDLIRRLEKKYGEGIEGVLEYGESAVRELEGLTRFDERLKELETALGEKEERLQGEAAALSLKRREVSVNIEKAVKGALKDLGMEKAEFVIDVRPAPLSSSGMDDVEFLFSANRGEAPKALGRVASGGELSRIMLALKGTLAEADRIPVLIFDEVDAGIGGRTAEIVGRRLKNLGKRHQVLCITHLPQIAAMADHHIMIEKEADRGGVCVKVKEPSAIEREEEIARMLGGKVTEISLRHAREMLGGFCEG